MTTCCYQRARHSDPSALEEIVESLRPRLVKMATYYARRTGTDAEDLLQEAWVGLLESLPYLDTRIGRAEQYLIRHARWRLLDHVRRMRLRACLPLDDSLEDGSRVEDMLAQASVGQFADRLRETQRKVLFGLLAGLTWREVGERLGCTSANVAYHVRLIRREYEVWNAAQS